MKCIDGCHTYQLDHYNDVNSSSFQPLKFYKTYDFIKDESCEPEPGTSNEEVLKALIHRIETLNSKFPCCENVFAITNLQDALMWLNKRTQDRVKRGVEGKHVV